jgi:hypothetical protein
MRASHCAFLITLFLVARLHAAPVVYDASAQFDRNNNPSALGPWSYGFHSTSLGAGFTMYDRHFDSAITGGTGNIWALLSDSDSLPQVAFNPNAVNITDGPTTVNALEFNLHPRQISGVSKYTVLRFTASIVGTYDINATFSGNSNSGTSTDVHILRNGVSVFDGGVSGFNTQTPFSGQVSLSSGDTIDFAVGDGGNGFSNDSTGLFATLTVPEPIGLAWVGWLAIGLRRARRGYRDNRA